MDEGAKISDHLSVLNGIISELEALGVKIEDEDKALRLILSLPPSYEHMKPVLMYGKESLNFAEVTGKLLSEERRLKSKGRASTENSTLVGSKVKKKNFMKDVVCWGYGQTGHMKRNCKDGLGSAKGSESDANSVSLFVRDGDVT